MNAEAHIIVVDDVCRFAYHLSRYFGFGLGFGIGRIPWHGRWFETNEKKHEDKHISQFWELEDSITPKPMTSSNGLIHLWWVPATDAFELGGKVISWREMLFTVTDRISSEQPIFAMIDMKGRLSRESTDAPRYEAKLVIEWFEEQVAKAKITTKEIYPISSYTVGFVQTAEGERQILPKSPETFRNIQKRVSDELRSKDKKKKPESRLINLDRSSPEESRLIHILVTGAGFEIGEESFLGSKRKNTFGLPATNELLGIMVRKRPFAKRGNQETDPDETQQSTLNNFRLLMEEEVDKTPVSSKLIRYLKQRKKNQAREDDHLGTWWKDLDTWWDWTLWHTIREELSHYLEEPNANPDVRAGRLEQEIKVIEFEYQMRDAFRKTILGHDWGFMHQSVIAPILNWDCWLTTNYTRFSDRSIQLAERLEEMWGEQSLDDLWRFGFNDWNHPSQAHLWRIIGTVNAAERLSMGHLHKDDFNHRVGRRYLFKLHGDIGQIHTMAIAGYDKEPHTQLSMSIDSINQIYNAAQSYLTKKCAPLTDKHTIVWHVVGHGLNDKLLTKLMTITDKRQLFILVDPSEDSRQNARHQLMADFKDRFQNGATNKSAKSRIDPLDGQHSIWSNKIICQDVNLKAAQYISHLFIHNLPRTDKGLNKLLAQLKHFEREASS